MNASEFQISRFAQKQVRTYQFLHDDVKNFPFLVNFLKFNVQVHHSMGLSREVISNLLRHKAGTVFGNIRHPKRRQVAVRRSDCSKGLMETKAIWLTNCAPDVHARSRFRRSHWNDWRRPDVDNPGADRRFWFGLCNKKSNIEDQRRVLEKEPPDSGR